MKLLIFTLSSLFLFSISKCAEVADPYDDGPDYQPGTLTKFEQAIKPFIVQKKIVGLIEFLKKNNRNHEKRNFENILNDIKKLNNTPSFYYEIHFENILYIFKCGDINSLDINEYRENEKGAQDWEKTLKKCKEILTHR